MKRKAINTCDDGTCRTLVAWYAKGGRSNFAAWNGPGRFLMTAVLEEYDDRDDIRPKRIVIDRHGYGTMDERVGSHMTIFSRKDISTTLTNMCGSNKFIMEIYDDSEGSEESDD